jgi:hypothetical protein
MKKSAPLPSKICALCGRTFMYRKKWARDWANVLYCSDRCRGTRDKTPIKPADPI